MQDIQNIPNPDINSTERTDEFGNHSDIEGENESRREVEKIPLPPIEPIPSPVKEPPAEINHGGIDQKNRAPKEIV